MKYNRDRIVALIDELLSLVEESIELTPLQKALYEKAISIHEGKPLKYTARSTLNNLQDFRSIFVQLPRRSGKTALIKYIAEIYGGIIIYRCGLPSKLDKTSLLFYDLIHSERGAGKRDLRGKLVLFDEVPPGELWEALSNNPSILYDEYTTFFGVYT